MNLIERLLGRHVRVGCVRLTLPNGKTRTMDGDQPGAECGIRIHDWNTAWRLLLDPSLAFGEAYMDGRLTFESGGLSDLMAIRYGNVGLHEASTWARLRAGILAQTVGKIRRSRAKSQSDVEQHYDLPEEFFRLFLDADLQYSCAYFSCAEDSLEQAQERKKKRIAAKLLLQDGHRVLDIGSGWGGMAMHIARQREDLRVEGVTLSSAQFQASQRRVAEAGLADRVSIRLQDYRDVQGQYDRIVSVGMLEHVGRENLSLYWRKLDELLTRDGVAVVHAIANRRRLGPVNAWTRKYIFPGGYLPTLSEICTAIEGTSLCICDVEILRLHYASTLAVWRQRFYAAIDQVRRVYGDRFVRMWDLYLAGSQAFFQSDEGLVFQVQAAKIPDAVPTTRDYLNNV